ncbi:MAG TPA: saccharopine dehydrogenase NADP-binding domain-containing protein [Candidatus Dormibacteraeota bacterium]|nr:saccharopine dehydrogenase NADP-binding domain-containing protein [Candidatus Dormibacteraeota bacterium]
MRRVVVVGGTGFFGRVAAERLRSHGVRAVLASRRAGAELRVDVENRSSMKTSLKPYDVVLDAAGPFQARTTALIEAAIETGFDVVDLSDSLRYAERVADLRLRIEAAGVRVLTSCSSVSAVGAAAIHLSGVEKPVRLDVVLRPATRDTAHRATARALFESVGRPIRVLRDGRLTQVTGWRESRRLRLPATGRRIRAYLSESADALLLQPAWPSLRRIEFHVDAHVPGMNLLLALSARSQAIRRAVGALLPLGLALCRLFGSRGGGILFEVEDSDGALVTLALQAPAKSYLVAIAPAVLAARAIAEGRFKPTGLVPPEQHAEASELAAYLGSLGIDRVTVRHGRRGV